MFYFKTGVVFAALFSAVWLSGCASAPSKSETTELQRGAMQRWNSCLERHADSQQLGVIQVSKLMRQDCEGYKRDLIALFPRHMADQVDQMLINSAYRYIESIDENSEEPKQVGDLMQTVLR